MEDDDDADDSDDDDDDEDEQQMNALEDNLNHEQEQLNRLQGTPFALIDPSRQYVPISLFDG